jgi:hypothetical protein
MQVSGQYLHVSDKSFSGDDIIDSTRVGSSEVVVVRYYSELQFSSSQ